MQRKLNKNENIIRQKQKELHSDMHYKKSQLSRRKKMILDKHTDLYKRVCKEKFSSFSFFKRHLFKAKKKKKSGVDNKSECKILVIVGQE